MMVRSKPADDASPSTRKSNCCAGKRLRESDSSSSGRGFGLGRLPTVNFTASWLLLRTIFSVADFARLGLGDEVEHRRGIGHRLTFDLDENVARLDAGLVGRPSAHHAGDQDAFAVAELEGFGEFGRDVLHFHADPAARDRAGLR